MTLRSMFKSRVCFAPDGGGGGGGGGGSDGGDLSGDALKGTSFEGQTIPAAFVKEGKVDVATLLSSATRPDPFKDVKVPDKFMKDGKVDVANFVKAHGELEQSQFRRREEVTAEVRTTIQSERDAAAPKAPGDYQPPEKWKIGEREISIDAKDPMFSYFAGLAHELRLPQDKFTEAIKGYVTASVAALPDWNNEAKTLGAHAEARLERVDGFLKGNLSANNYNWFARQPATAAGVKAFEELMTLSGHPPIVGDTDDVGSETYTKADLQKMQRDPRYTGEKGQVDPSFVAKVRAGFQKLARESK